MKRCFWCECLPCFLDCEERRRSVSRARDGANTGIHLRTLHVADKHLLLRHARRLLREGQEVGTVAAQLGMKPMDVSVIKYRMSQKYKEVQARFNIQRKLQRATGGEK